MHPATKEWRALRKNIGNNLRHHRTHQKLTLEKLSKLSGVPTLTIDQYEIGKNEPHLFTIIKLAQTLQVYVRALIR